MKRKTLGLLAAATLALAPAVVLTTAAPASASGCGTTTVNQTAFAATFDTSDTRATGHNEFGPDYTGVHVYTEGATSTDKAAAYYRNLSIPLADQTANANYNLNVTNNASAPAGAPGYQLQIDANGLDTPGGFATLVYEPAFYQGRWWTNSAQVQGVPARDGYAHSGSLDEYVASNPNAVITAFGYSLGSGVKGDVVVESITFGCNVFAFRYEAPAPIPNVAPTAAFDATVTGYDVAFNGSASTDSDGTIVSYFWEFGDGDTNTTTGPTDGHTYAPGTYNVKLTVTDDDGAIGTATKTITIVATNTVQDGALPNTGAEAFGLIGIGGLILLAGGGFYWAASTRYKRRTAA